MTHRACGGPFPLAPRCYFIKEFEGKDVVVHYCGASALPAFDAAVEAERSHGWCHTVLPFDGVVVPFKIAGDALLRWQRWLLAG